MHQLLNMAAIDTISDVTQEVINCEQRIRKLMTNFSQFD